MLCYSTSDDLENWSKPVFFLEEAVHLPWNQANRVIDPTFVTEGERLHCFFVGTDRVHYASATNLVGHAYTDDPELKGWTITTVDSPLIGTCEDGPDGAENVTVFRNNNEWVMIYSEGLKSQHLAYITSKDLIHWGNKGKITIPEQSWMSTRYGAPYVWKEDEYWVMILMGEDRNSHTTFGLLTSRMVLSGRRCLSNKHTVKIYEWRNAMKIYVSKNSGGGDGSREYPYHSVAQAAKLAQPGDEIIVAPGVYREAVDPVHAGTPEQRIIYRSEVKNKAIITGAEEVKNWKRYRDNVWKVNIP